MIEIKRRIVYLIRFHTENSQEYLYFHKKLTFIRTWYRQNQQLWWHFGDTMSLGNCGVFQLMKEATFWRILVFWSWWEGWLSCATDGLVGLVQDILAMKGEFIKAFHKHRQEHYRGLSEGFLWHSTCQDNTIGRMWQVHVSAVMTRRTRFFGWTTSKNR